MFDVIWSFWIFKLFDQTDETQTKQQKKMCDSWLEEPALASAQISNVIVLNFSIDFVHQLASLLICLAFCIFNKLPRFMSDLIKYLCKLCAQMFNSFWSFLPTQFHRICPVWRTQFNQIYSKNLNENDTHTHAPTHKMERTRTNGTLLLWTVIHFWAMFKRNICIFAIFTLSALIYNLILWVC